MSEIEHKISWGLHTLDDLSIPSFLLYRFVILPVLLILDIVFFLLSSPLTMCLYILGFFDKYPGERSFSDYIIKGVLYWFYVDLYVFIFLEYPEFLFINSGKTRQ